MDVPHNILTASDRVLNLTQGGVETLKLVSKYWIVFLLSGNCLYPPVFLACHQNNARDSISASDAYLPFAGFPCLIPGTETEITGAKSARRSRQRTADRGCSNATLDVTGSLDAEGDGDSPYP